MEMLIAPTPTHFHLRNGRCTNELLRVGPPDNLVESHGGPSLTWLPCFDGLSWRFGTAVEHRANGP